MKIFKKYILFLLLFSFAILKSQEDKRFIVMLEPAGHAKNIGRKLLDGYERAQTMQMALRLQKELQEKYDFKVVLTRIAGEEIADFQNASFANKLNVDFYLSLNIFLQEDIKPKIFLYQLAYNPLADFSSRSFDPYDFLPLSSAHIANINKSKFYGLNIKKGLVDQDYQKNFDFYGLYAMPFKPLRGIISPALALDLGICQDNKWQSLIDPIVKSLAFLNKN